MPPPALSAQQLARPRSAPQLHTFPHKQVGLSKTTHSRSQANSNAVSPAKQPAFPQTPSHIYQAPKAQDAEQKSTKKDKGARFASKTYLRLWRAKVQHSWELLESAPPQILEDRDFMLTMARNNVKSLTLFPSELIEDRDFLWDVIETSTEGWRVFEYIPKIWRDDQELMLLAMQSEQGWRALQFAPEEMLADQEFMLECVETCGTSLELAAPELRDLPEVFMASLQSFSDDLTRASGSEAKVLWHLEGVQGSRRPSSAKGVDLMRRKTQRASVVARQQALLQEMNDKKTTFSRDEEGNILRLVQVALINVQRSDGLMLVEVATKKAVNQSMSGLVYGYQIRCGLPGGKFKEGEEAADACKRLLREQLGPLTSGLNISTEDFTVEARNIVSDRLQVKTRYFKAIFSGTLSSDFPWSKVLLPLAVPQSEPHARNRYRAFSSFSRRFCTRDRPHCRPDVYRLIRDWNKPHSNQSLYAWLPAWEMKWLTNTKAGSKQLEAWMAELLPTDAAERGFPMSAVH